MLSKGGVIVFSFYALIGFWLVMAILFVVIELATVGLASIWFAAGALAALLVAILHGNIVLQVIVFLVVSIGLLVATRPWAMKYLNSKIEKTNVDRVIGQRTQVTERVNNLDQTGKAVVLGQEWTVRAVDDNVTIEQGELVEVVSVSGVKLIVRRIKED